jgi:hypothetical protein
MHATPQFLLDQGFSKTFAERFWKKVIKDGPIPKHRPELGPCWGWTSCKTDFGYGRIGRGGEAGGCTTAPVASWLLHFGPVPEGEQVLHHCDNPQCCRPEHLWTGTQKENLADMTKKGRRVTAPHDGENHPGHKLTALEVAIIRRAWREGTATQQSLADRFGVTQGHVNNILRDRCWT